MKPQNYIAEMKQLTAPNPPPRGYRQDQDSVSDTSSNPKETPYSVVNVTENAVRCNVYIYIYIHMA